jgi:hypothetical protein
MFKLIVICLLVSVLLMMCSCAKVPPPGDYVNEIRLEDGTRCALLIMGSYIGGIDCDWKRPNLER